MESPKAFISYCWSSDYHVQWVLDLATELMESGIEVIIDKWDLKEGHDAIAFMERMVTDDTVTKVIVILDRAYSEKANDRSGGVGTETQIITPQLYRSVNQNKFVGVISERDPAGNEYLPTFYASRIYIDMSNEELRASNFEQLVRWVFDRPAYPKPPIGRRPEYLDELQVLLPTRAKANRAISLLKSGNLMSASALQDYLEAISDNMPALQLDPQGKPDFDEEFIASIEAFRPYREEFVAVVTALAKSNIDERNIRSLIQFFERMIPWMFRREGASYWNTLSVSNYRFIVHELFLHLVAVLVKFEHFSIIDNLLSTHYYIKRIPDLTREPMASFAMLRQTIDALDLRNRRLTLNRAVLQADLIDQRSSHAATSLYDLMQADLILYLRDVADALKTGRRNMWWPVTLIFSEREHSQMEIFARSISEKYYSKLRLALGVKSDEDFKQTLERLTNSANLFIPHAGYWSLDLDQLIQPGKLGTRP